jgi:hypothetical protein
MALDVKWEQRGVFVTGTGAITDDELDAANRAIQASPNLTRMRFQLVDGLGVTELRLSRVAIQRAAKLDAELSMRFPGVKVAIVLQGPLAFGLARMYELSAVFSQWETRIFSTVREARSWIGEHEQANVH